MPDPASSTEVSESAPVSAVSKLLGEDHTPWYKKKNLRRLYFFLIPVALGVDMTSGFDGSILNGLQAVDPWLKYFSYPQGALLGILSAAFHIGAFIVLPLCPWVNDRFGRKKSILFGTLLAIVGATLQAASVNFAMFLSARLILGFGIPFAITGASSMLAEVCYPKERAVITGLFNVSWFVGSIIAAGVVLGTFAWPNDWSWRLPSLLQMLPAVLQLSFIWFVPESPRWLISKGRHEEAFEVLVKYHAEGDRENAFVHAEFKQIKETLRLEAEASQNPWKDLLKTNINRRRLFVSAAVGLFSQWSGNGLVSYYLAKILSFIGITNRKSQNQINLGLSCSSFCWGILGAFLTRVLRRRTQYLLSFTGMLVMFTCVTACSAVYAQNNSNYAAAVTVVAMIFFYNASYQIMQPLHYIYMTELFPFISRSKGLALTQFFARGGGAFNLFVNPIGLQNLAWKYYLVFVGWLCCEIAIIYFVYLETKTFSLEEAAVLVEGKDAAVEISMGAATNDKEEPVVHIVDRFPKQG